MRRQWMVAAMELDAIQNMSAGNVRIYTLQSDEHCRPDASQRILNEHPRRNGRTFEVSFVDQTRRVVRIRCTKGTKPGPVQEVTRLVGGIVTAPFRFIGNVLSPHSGNGHKNGTSLVKKGNGSRKPGKGPKRRR